jgi:hypothetical protein
VKKQQTVGDNMNFNNKYMRTKLEKGKFFKRNPLQKK